MKQFSVAIMLMLAACGAPEAEEAAQALPDQSRAPAPVPALTNNEPPMPPGVRRPTLAEFGQVLGNECPTPSSSEYKGSEDGTYSFAVKCAAGDLLVSIKADGSATSVPCAITEKLGENLCNEMWDN